MFAVSSLPAPSGLTVLQTMVRFGMPPTESIPAACQFGLASRSAGRMPRPSLSGEATAVAAWLRAVAADPTVGDSRAKSAATKKADLTEGASLSKILVRSVLHAIARGKAPARMEARTRHFRFPAAEATGRSRPAQGPGADRRRTGCDLSALTWNRRAGAPSPRVGRLTAPMRGEGTTCGSIRARNAAAPRLHQQPPAPVTAPA